MRPSDYNKLEPIHRAALDGDLAALNGLLQERHGLVNRQVVDGTPHPFDVHYYNGFGGCTPLRLAAWRGHDAVVERLLELGADVMLEDYAGEVAAGWACKDDGQLSTLRLLIAAGTPLNVKAGDGTTLLMGAVMSNNTDLVHWLLGHGNEAVEVKARGGWMDDTALHVAAAHSSPIVRLLLRAGADPSITDRHDKTPLHSVRRNGGTECIALLEHAAFLEPERAYLISKLYTIADASVAVPAAGEYARARGEVNLVQFRRSLAAAPPTLKPRVENGVVLPRVVVRPAGNWQQRRRREGLAGSLGLRESVTQMQEKRAKEEKLLAVLKYVIGQEGGATGQGMLPELCVELCEMLVPTPTHQQPVEPYTRWEPPVLPHAGQGHLVGGRGWNWWRWKVLHTAVLVALLVLVREIMIFVKLIKQIRNN